MGKNTIGDVNGEIINIIQNSGIFSKYISNDNKIELSKDLDITPPPLPAKVIKRKSLIENIQKDLSSQIFFNIKGEIGTGKTQFCNLLIQSYKNNLFWFRVRDYENQIKSLIIELSNIISNSQRFKPLRYFSKEMKIPKNSILILDDLPNLIHLNIDKEFLTLVTQCKDNNIKIISSSNYLIPHSIYQHFNDDFKNISIPNFSEEDTLELLELNNAPEKLNKFAKLINTYSDNHPSLIIATINYFQSINWKLTFEEFLQNKFINNELHNFQLMLENTVKDENARELAYRLNNVGRIVTENDIRMVSSIEPKIDHPFEKLSQLLNIWIYKESESEYLLSPILFRLGSKNLDINVEEKVNLILGSQIFQKTTLSPYDIMRGIIYYIKGKDYNKAGWHLYQALQLIIKNEAIKEDDVLSLHMFWIDSNFPKEIDISLQLLLRGHQIIIHNRFGKDTSKLYKQFLELREQIPKEKEYILLLPYSMFASYNIYTEDTADKTFKIIKELPDKIKKELTPPEKDKNNFPIESLALFNIQYLTSYDNLEEWINFTNDIEPQKLSKILEIDVDIDFLNLLEHQIKQKIIRLNSKENIEKIYTLICNNIEIMYKNSIEKIWVYFVAIAIECLINLDRFDKALEMRNHYIQLTNNFDFKLLINQELSIKYVDNEEYELAKILYEDILSEELNNSTRFVDACVYASISYVNLLDMDKSKYFFEKAISIYKKLNNFDELFMSKILGEYSILLWNINFKNEALEVCEQILMLIEKQNDLNDEWKVIELILGNNLGYFSSMLIKGEAPTKDYSAPKNRNFLYTGINSELLKYYSIEKEFLLYYHLSNIFYYINNPLKAQKYLFKSFKSSESSTLEDLKIIINFDFYLNIGDYEEYMEEMLKIHSHTKSDIVILLLLPIFMKLLTQLFHEVNHIKYFKESFIKKFKSIINDIYFNGINYILDIMDDKKETNKPESDWILQRFYFLYEVNNCNLGRAHELHKHLSHEMFTSEYSQQFSEYQKRIIFEDYFFQFWIYQITIVPEYFKYSQILIKNVITLYNENIKSHDKIDKLLFLVNNYIKQ